MRAGSHQNEAHSIFGHVEEGAVGSGFELFNVDLYPPVVALLERDVYAQAGELSFFLSPNHFDPPTIFAGIDLQSCTTKISQALLGGTVPSQQVGNLASLETHYFTRHFSSARAITASVNKNIWTPHKDQV